MNKQRVLCVEADTKLQCGLCVSKPMTVRTAYTHFQIKHDGTYGGPFIRDQCELIRCEDKEKIYQLRPDDGIICNLCERGLNCGNFMTLAGFKTHITHSCPKVVSYEKREKNKEKWRNDRNANGRKKEEKVDEESGSDDDDETEESERGEDGANEGDNTEKKKTQRFSSWCDEKYEKNDKITNLSNGDKVCKKFKIGDEYEWFIGEMVSANKILYSDGEDGRVRGKKGLGRGTSWFKYDGDYNDDINYEPI